MKYTKKWMVVQNNEVENNDLTSIIENNNITTSEKLRLYREHQMKQNNSNQKLRENIQTHNSHENQNDQSYSFKGDDGLETKF